MTICMSCRNQSSLKHFTVLFKKVGQYFKIIQNSHLTFIESTATADRRSRSHVYSMIATFKLAFSRGKKQNYKPCLCPHLIHPNLYSATLHKDISPLFVFNQSNLDSDGFCNARARRRSLVEVTGQSSMDQNNNHMFAVFFRTSRDMVATVT